MYLVRTLLYSTRRNKLHAKYCMYVPYARDLLQGLKLFDVLDLLSTVGESYSMH